MKAVLKKVDGIWTIIGKCNDGTFVDYRFVSEEAAKHWAKLTGIKSLEVVDDAAD